VRRVGWITRDTEVERNYWLNCQKPASQFFVRTNPGYVEGNGLLTLVPFDGPNLSEGMRRFGASQARRRVSSLKSRLGMETHRRLPLGRIGKMLRDAPLFRQLPDWDLDHLAEVVQVVHHLPGQHVIRKGEPGDAMYVIADGAAFIQVPGEGGEELLIDEIATGEAFGEMALLAGEPRSASVRAASELTLLRIGREPFLKLLAADRDLRDAIWDAYVMRSFRSYMLGVKRFAHLDAQARMRWIRGGRRVEIAAGGQHEPTEASFVFVAAGRVDVERGSDWIALTAPALVEIGGPTKITSAAGAVLSLLGRPEAGAATGGGAAA